MGKPQNKNFLSAFITPPVSYETNSLHPKPVVPSLSVGLMSAASRGRDEKQERSDEENSPP